MVAATGQQQSAVPGRAAPALERAAGAGGLVFVATVIIQNIVRASGPSFTAAPATVTAYFAGHRTAGLIPLALFPLGMAGLFCFAAGLRARAHGEPARWWSALGALAVVTIAGLFAIVNVTEIVIAARGTDLAGAPQVAGALWAIHSGAFGLNLCAIAIALLGLSQAARAAALIPRPLAVIAVPGAACLFIASVFTVAIVNGGKWLYLGYAGFAVWAVFLAVTGIALIAGRAERQARA